MTDATSHGRTPAAWRSPMGGRDPLEENRTATPLELLFDLVFVVAIGQIAAQLAHSIVEHDLGNGLVGYLTVFFAVWWAWMNFTWFASAYDVDDVPYRLMTLLQIAGVLILAASVQDAFLSQDFTWIVVGYVVMRVAMVGQWLRAAAGHPDGRTTALRYALGVTVVQIGWLARLWLPDDWSLPSFIALAVAELVVPLAAERTGRTPWHPEHIAERYGLFTIIVLGEVVLAATLGVQKGLNGHTITLRLGVIAGSALVLLFGLWWLYFLRPFAPGLERRTGREYVWGYVHYGVFASLAALGAGLEVAAEAADHHADPAAATWAVAIPIAVFFLLLAGLSSVLGMAVPSDVTAKVAAAAVVIAIAAFVHDPVVSLPLICLPIAALVARGAAHDHRERQSLVSPRT